MNIKPIHTNILEKKTIGDLHIIRENTDNYPKGKSNIYAKNSFGKIIWYAELPLTGDTYPNPIQWNKSINSDSKIWTKFIQENSNSFVVSSWNCYTVSIDYRNGKILQEKFTK